MILNIDQFTKMALELASHSPNFHNKPILRYNFESGWLEQKMIEEFAGYTECLTEGHAEVQSLQMEHTVGTFLILAMGCTVAAIVLLAEMYWKYFKKNVPSDVQNKTTNDKEIVINYAYHANAKSLKIGGMLNYFYNKD
ncbi:hypothetical protein TNCV_2875011 [Trichonephila clavipes]|nr:hypothetical protein TNCV_2875011 [Trichonephila clavipes]